MKNKKPLASGKKANGAANGTNGTQTPPMYHIAAPAVNQTAGSSKPVPKFTFGKFKGQAPDSTPTWYLEYVLTFEDLDSYLRDRILLILSRRGRMNGGRK